VGIIACLVLCGMSSLAWLHDDLTRSTKIAVELLCCFVLAIDLFFHRQELGALLHKGVLRLITFLAVVPWYTLITSAFSMPDESMAIFLAHSSSAPFLYYRFRAYSREHVAPKSVRLSVIAVLAFFCMHWLASLWILLRPTKDVDFATEYNMAMYFITTTLSTIGYGDITPNDNISRIYTMGVQLLGVCVFGVVIGQVSRLLMDADKRREHAKNQLESLASLFKHYNIPSDLQKKSYRFLHHVLAHAANEDEEKVLNALPLGLQSELRTHMNAKPISKVSLFYGCSHACHIEAAKELQQVYFTPGQDIIKKGDTGDVMFLIGHGRVDVHDGDRHIASLADGQVFGEMALLADEKRGADVTAVTHCDVFVLSRERFQHLLAHHADLRANVEKVAHSRKKS
jgi:hypothetical protein